MKMEIDRADVKAQRLGVQMGAVGEGLVQVEVALDVRVYGAESVAEALNEISRRLGDES